MTAQDVINQVRDIIEDAVVPYRISDADFFQWIDNAVRETESRRPDLILGSDGTLSGSSDITAVTDAIALPDRFTEALARHVAFSSYINDDPDRHNTSQASAMLQRFESLIATL